VRTRKESERVRGTHFLESTEGMTSEATERKRASEGHSQTGKRERQVTSRKASERESDMNVAQDVKILRQSVWMY